MKPSGEESDGVRGRHVRWMSAGPGRLQSGYSFLEGANSNIALVTDAKPQDMLWNRLL